MEGDKKDIEVEGKRGVVSILCYNSSFCIVTVKSGGYLATLTCPEIDANSTAIILIKRIHHLPLPRKVTNCRGKRKTRRKKI